MEATYMIDDKDYDVSKFAPEGQKAFELLAMAEQQVTAAQNSLTLAQAASVALHAKVQEYLTDEAIKTEEE